MRILVDICHPAHFHFFHYTIGILQDAGHEILVTSRNKDVALNLLRQTNWPQRQLSRSKPGIWNLAAELVTRNWALYRTVKHFRPHCMTAVGGTFIAHVGAATRTRSVVFYDTETAKLQNLITYPFASQLIVPRCYYGWVPKGTQRYNGYHELAYLHPHRFTPNLDTAIRNGIDPLRENILIRLVAWGANHDVGKNRLRNKFITEIIETFGTNRNLLISAEGTLPPQLAAYQYKGNPSELHHVLAHSRLLVGESATMASEAAVLGVPAIYAADFQLGYCLEQEKKYQLVTNLPPTDEEGILASMHHALSFKKNHWLEKRKALLKDTVDVSKYAAKIITGGINSRFEQ